MSTRQKHSRSNQKYETLKRRETQSGRRSKHEDEESKTPPLPDRRKDIEELYKKREYLKNELKKMEKLTGHTLYNKKPIKKQEQSNAHAETDLHKATVPQKRNIVNGDKLKTNSIKTTHPQKDSSESEDEDSLIEKGRKRRQQLLQKFNVIEEVRHAEVTHGLHQNDTKLKYKICPNNNSVTSSVKQPTDMFSVEDYVPKKELENMTQDNQKNPELADNWDDSEGYYIVRVGYKLNDDRYTIKNIQGRGVFANVVHAQDSYQNNADVAIKIIRNNEAMFKTGMKEIGILKNIKEADPKNKYHCVRLLHYFVYKKHLCIVLEPLKMDLRCFIKKYVKDGLSLKILIIYSRQLLTALRLLKKIGIIHADIKPDNILINEKKNCIKLCDYGSGFNVNECEPTPYMVSRFYRAPEIILGVPYRHSVDIWATACTLFELATGKIMFPGGSNNKMLKYFLDLKGKYPNKFINKGIYKEQHFNNNDTFLLHKKDEFTGRQCSVEINNTTPSRDLQRDLRKYYKEVSPDEDKKLSQFKDFLDKMLILDINQRATVSDCLRHEFITEPL